MNRLVAASLLFPFFVGAGSALVSAAPPNQPSDEDIAAAFASWAAVEGTPVTRVVCSVDLSAPPESAVCYGMAEGPVAIGAYAELTSDDAGALVWDGFENPSAGADETTSDVLATTVSVATSTTSAAATSTTAQPTTTASTSTTTTVDPSSPFPIEVGASGPVVAAIQGRLGVSVDCDFGNQTRRAVEQWQENAGIPVTGVVDELAWELLDVPTTWGQDSSANGTIEPGEVNLICDGDVELPPPPVDTTGWPNTTLAFVAEACSVADEYTYPDDNGPDARYNPSEDTITIIGAGAEDYTERGEAVFDTMICVLGLSGVPDRVVNQLSTTRAIDGMQFAEWDGFAMQWNYHPDSGMSLTIYST